MLISLQNYCQHLLIIDRSDISDDVANRSLSLISVLIIDVVII